MMAQVSMRGISAHLLKDGGPVGKLALVPFARTEKDGMPLHQPVTVTSVVLTHLLKFQHWHFSRAQNYKIILIGITIVCNGFLCLILVTRLKRSSTYVTSPTVERYTARHRIWGLTSAGTRENDPSSAAGPFAASASPVQTSSSATRGHIQVKEPRGQCSLPNEDIPHTLWRWALLLLRF